MGGKKGDTERETQAVKDGCVQEVKQVSAGERKRMELLMIAVAYRNDRWNRKKKQRAAKTMEKKK